MERIFVYGTLRRGDCRDLGVRYAGATFISAGWISGELFNLGEYPGVRLGGTERVVGEVFEVSEVTLLQLDAMEGDEYTRVPVSVNTPDGEVGTYWVYEVLDWVCADSPKIESGDWFARSR